MENQLQYISGRGFSNFLDAMHATADAAKDLDMMPFLDDIAKETKLAFEENKTLCKNLNVIGDEQHQCSLDNFLDKISRTKKLMEDGSAEPGSSQPQQVVEGDMVLEVVSQMTKCPITQKAISDPVINPKCQHTYERSGLRTYIAAMEKKGVHMKQQCRCPVSGCTATVSKKLL